MDSRHNPTAFTEARVAAEAKVVNVSVDTAHGAQCGQFKLAKPRLRSPFDLFSRFIDLVVSALPVPSSYRAQPAAARPYCK